MKKGLIKTITNIFTSEEKRKDIKEGFILTKQLINDGLIKTLMNILEEDKKKKNLKLNARLTKQIMADMRVDINETVCKNLKSANPRNSDLCKLRNCLYEMDDLIKRMEDELNNDKLSSDKLKKYSLEARNIYNGANKISKERLPNK